MSRREILIVPVCCLLLAAAVYPGAAFSAGYYANGEDLAGYAATRTLIRDAYRGFHLPLWNPYSGCGEPLVANPELQAYYPPAVLSVLLPPGIAMNWLMILHTALAGWGMWLLLRSRGLRLHGAAFGAAAFMLSGFLASHRVHVAVHASAAWAPLAVFFWYRVREGAPLRYLVAFTVALSFQILAGGFQIVLMTLVLLAGREIYGFLARRESRLRLLILTSGFAMLLSAVQLLPAVFLSLRTGFFVAGPDSFFRDAMSLKALVTLIIPFFDGAVRDGFFGPAGPGRAELIETMLYIGILPLVFFAVAIVRAFREPGGIDRVFWVLAAFFALALLPGKYSPLAWLFHALPVTGSLRVPERWIFLVHFAVAVAGAMAFDRMNRSRRTRTADFLIAICGVWVLVLPLASEKLRATRLVAPAIMIFLCTGYLVLASRMRHRHFRWVAVGLLVFDLAFFTHFFDLPEPVAASSITRSGNPVANALPDEGPVPTRIGSAVLPAGTQSIDILAPNVNVACRFSSPLWLGPYGSPHAKLLLGARGNGGCYRDDAALANQKIISLLGTEYILTKSRELRSALRQFDRATPPIDIPLVHNRSETSETRGVAESGETVSYLARRAVTRWQLNLRRRRFFELSFEARYVEKPGGYFNCELGGENYSAPYESWHVRPEHLEGEFRPMRHAFYVGQGATNPMTLQIRSEGSSAVELRNLRLREFPTGFGPGYDFESYVPGRAQIYRNPAVLPRVFCVGCVKSLGDALLVKEAMWDRDFEPAKTAFVENEPGLEGRYGAGIVEIINWTSGQMTVEVSGDDKMFLVVADSFRRGWRCWIDGEEVRIHRADTMLRGVVVPPGKHEVLFECRALGCYVGWGVSIFAWLLLLLGFLLYRRWKRTWPHLFESVEGSASNVQEYK